MQVQVVAVRVERVPCIPRGVKVLIDEPNGEDCVAWVRDDLDEREAMELIARGLSRSPGRHGSPGLALFAS